jgi:hypothetical protein
MSSEPPVNSKAPEVQKEFAETISRARKFLISSAIILIILIVVVGQELREYRDKQASFVKQIQTTARSEGESVKRLFQEYARIRCELKKTVYENGQISRGCDLTRRADKNSISTRAGFEIADVPKGMEGAHSAREVDALVRGEQKLAELIKKVEVKLEEEKKEQKKQPPPPTRPNGASKTLTAIAVTQGAETGPRSALAARSAGPETDGATGEEESDDKLPLTGLVYHLRSYKELYGDRIALARVHLSTKKESDDLKTAKKSIPTPFGNFQIAPKLALLGLAFAVIITYFVFYNYVRRVRRLANEEAVAGPDSASLRIPAPFWSPDPGGGPTSQSSSDVVLSVSLHVLWVGVGIWLVFESLATWKATKALEFDYKSFWGYLLLLAVLVSVFIAIQQYFPASFKNRFLARNGPDGSTRFPRRRFVYLGAIGALGVLTAVIYRVSGSRKRPKAVRPQLTEFTATPEEAQWVQNAVTGVIHYRPVCEKHLPKKNRQLKELSPALGGVHAGLQARIWLDLSERAARPPEPEAHHAQQDKNQVAYLQKAIAASPLSLHLYDRLCRVYGSLKLYDQIVPLFEGGLKEVEKRLAELPNPPQKVSDKRRSKSLNRWKEDFNLRIKQVGARKEEADEFRAEMAEKDRKKNEKQ